MSHRRFVPRTLAALLAVAAFAGGSVATLPAVAHAAHITKAQAQRAAKRAASRRVARSRTELPAVDVEGRLPAGSRRVALQRRTGGQCSADIVVGGTARRPVARVRDMRCFG